jgi:hypothetical protein
MKKETYILIIILCMSFSSCETKKEQNSIKSSNKIDEVSIQKEQDSINQVQKEKEVDSIAKINIYNPFLTLDTDEVIAYDYETNFDSAKRFIIDDEGKLNPTVAKQRTLTKTQVSTLKTFLGSTDTYGENRPDCFEPHLGIVFYKDDKVVAHVSICISCRHLDSSVEIPATTYRGYRTDGFNPKAIEFLNDFCQSLEFSYCKN